MNHSMPTCRSCGASDLYKFLDLGRTPLADRLLTKEQLDGPEPFFPLEVAYCPRCSLVQILETVQPELLFCDDYPYYSSFLPALLKHSRDNVMELIDSRRLSAESLVVELASNDGYLLKNYVEKGIPVLGVDPADGPASEARKKGVPTLNTFFTVELAQDLRKQGLRADIIHANNVLAHVKDTNGFVEGISCLLKDDGVVVIEVPYVRDLIDHCEFDTIYHEHLCYFSVTALNHLFRRYGLFINDIRQLSIHGGSLRLYAEKKENRAASVRSLLEEESNRSINQLSYYRDFAQKVEGVRTSLLELQTRLKEEGKTIAAYGAAAKGSTLINYVGIGEEFIDFVVDRNTYKHGKFMPGKHLPIYGTEQILEKMPDYLLILAWNFADEIMQQQEQYQQRGGRFIIPIPDPRIV